MKLKINVIDLMDKVPQPIAQLLLNQKDIFNEGTYCEKDFYDCWLVISGNDEKLSAIKDILKSKGLRVEELK